MSIAVVDIDGVVADVTHRLPYLDQRPKDWAGFFRAAAEDPPLPRGVALVHELKLDHDIIWLTGRPAWLAPVTRSWLHEQGLPIDGLHTRGDRDRRPARLYKVTMLKKLAEGSIAHFIDDDVDVIAAARAAGFPATLADWLPRAAAMRQAQDRIGRS